MILWVVQPNQQCHSSDEQLVNQVKSQSHQKVKRR